MDIKGPVTDATSAAKQNVDSAAKTLQDVANETAAQAGAVASNMRKAVDKSLSGQPYATLVMAGVMGFVLGAVWKS